MNIHEFQAKKLLSEYGIPVPRGGVAFSPEEALNVVRELGGIRWVVKAQIHGGARGTGHFLDDPHGGVRIVESMDEVTQVAGDMLAHVLVTEQTRNVGQEVKCVYIEELLDVERELYLGMLVDPWTSRVTLIASTEGGISIGSITSDFEKELLRLPIDPFDGLHSEQARDIASRLKLDNLQADSAVRIMMAMYEVFITLDASLIEIDPLAVTATGDLLALNAIVNFDNNALFRHPDIRALRDEEEAGLGELQAAQHGLDYVKLDGNIGCFVSGAGLARATMDLIRNYGGRPANYLDVPAVTKTEVVTNAFKLIVSDPDVESILVNVFGGGIMRCDALADGLIAATKEAPLPVPVVARLAGANDLWGAEKLRESGLAITFAHNMEEAVEVAVRAAEVTDRALRQDWWNSMRDMFNERGDSPGDVNGKVR